MQTVYVLVTEYGEYENFTRTILGVFSSASAAHDAIPKFKELGRAQWELYKNRDTRLDEYLKRFEPSDVWPPGIPFPDGCILYGNDQYKEADAACGPEVALIPDGDKYVVEQFNLDAIAPPTENSSD